MFKNIFPKLNKFVYLEAPGANAEQAAESAEVSTEALQDEAKSRVGAIDDFMIQLEYSLSRGAVKGSFKIDRTDPNKKYEELDDLQQDVVSMLIEARNEFQGLAKSKDISRLQLDMSRNTVDAAMTNWNAVQATGDQLYEALMERVPNAEATPREAIAKAEKPESDFTKLARLMDSFRDLDDVSENQDERAKLGLQIVNILKGFEALESGKYSVGDVALLVQAGKKPGQYMLVLGKDVEGPAKMWERIFVGTEGHPAFSEDFEMDDSELISRYAKQRGKRLG